MNSAEKRHLDRLAQLGCIVCWREHNVCTPGEIHHINSHSMGKKTSGWLALCLCPDHHRNGGHGVAIHAGKETWERMYGGELELLAATLEMLEEER